MTIDTKAIEERVAKATPGPWEGVSDHPVYAIAAGRYRVSQTANQNNYGKFDASHGWHGIQNHADADFIAHARTDIPALLSAVKEKDAEIARLRQELELATGHEWQTTNLQTASKIVRAALTTQEPKS